MRFPNLRYPVLVSFTLAALMGNQPPVSAETLRFEVGPGVTEYVEVPVPASYSRLSMTVPVRSTTQLNVMSVSSGILQVKDYISTGPTVTEQKVRVVEKVVVKPIYLEKPVYVDRPVYVEWPIERVVEKPIVIEKEKVVEKPVIIERRVKHHSLIRLGLPLVNLEVL